MEGTMSEILKGSAGMEASPRQEDPLWTYSYRLIGPGMRALLVITDFTSLWSECEVLLTIGIASVLISIIMQYHVYIPQRQPKRYAPTHRKEKCCSKRLNTHTVITMIQHQSRIETALSASLQHPSLPSCACRKWDNHETNR